MHDIYAQIVCSSFGVPDVLSAEQQVMAAGAALLRAAEMERPESAMALVNNQRFAASQIELVTEMLRAGHLSPIIGQYVVGTPHDQQWLASQLAEAAMNSAPPTGGLPAETNTTLAKVAVERVVEWVQAHPDAVRQLRQQD